MTAKERKARIKELEFRLDLSAAKIRRQTKGKVIDLAKETLKARGESVPPPLFS
jgi:hypothetical protein